MRREIAIVVFPGFQLLDAAGPIAVFEMAERFRPDSYAIHVLAPGGGVVRSSSGVCLAAAPIEQRHFDTVIVSGGNLAQVEEGQADIAAMLGNDTWRRAAGVCSGAFLLADAGLLDGRRATTHWAAAERFRQRYPKVRLDADRMFVRDGNTWTSAGISAGIDLALALVEDDLGPGIARRAAQQLVVHQRRHGGQSQYSVLVEQGGKTGRFGDLISWMRARIGEPMTVERLAERAAMSPRNFARAFAAEIGATPAKVVEGLRLEAARVAVETSHAHLDHIAASTGFGDSNRMRRAFVRAFGSSPQSLRRSASA
ncbi:GlxA family transcriptional regulator [Dyella mobilis]|uniref:GlxA family transcriptional regulator n=1 Tax=Dyella mobilis TaxID=1849582 RepID=A0ABS2KHN3_9GAMM|nr:GlxA family transcriptional regulator [Dyella mobilis]MBM7130636.1 GlxA family transcriptional regulator [Dyella mobilis]GLQ97263.1 AraC family transcriptional regulator [Dyella mobilis]